MSSYQLTTPRALISFLLSLLLYLTPICAETFVWPDAIRYIDFGDKASPLFTRFSLSDFAEPVNVWISFHPELGPYGGHVWRNGKLEYTLDLTADGFELVDLKLGFAEVFLPACTDNGRILRVSVNDKTFESVNIFKLVGCREPHDIIFEQISAASPIKVVIEGIVENPMISNILVRQTAAKFQTQNASASISRDFGAYNKVLFIGAASRGRANFIPATAVFKDRKALIEGTVRPQILLGHRHGRNFTYRIRGRGTYEIQLSFAEVNPAYCDGITNRVFSVFFNGKLELDQLNVFKEQGCRRAFIYTSSLITLRGDFLITFAGVTGNAMVSHIMARKVQTSCTPESTADAATSDHLAHSVPGSYPPIRSADSRRAYVDGDNNGFERVFINGDGSHTHFFDTVNNIAGKITSYEWTSPDTTEFISDKVAFRMNFRLGTTRLSLRVQDNICTSHTSETSVTVTGSISSGTYCYFYPGQTTMLDGGGPDQELKPSFAKAYPDTNWNFGDLPFARSDFAARCLFFLSVDSTDANIRGFVTTKGSANVTLLRGTDTVVDNMRAVPFSAPLVASISSFEVLYLRVASRRQPILRLSFRPPLEPSYSYDRSTVFPVITSLSPRSSSLAGETNANVQVLGPSLAAIDVIIGNKTVPISRRDTDKRKLFFDIPSSDTPETVSICIKWDGGLVSNSLSFVYFDGPANDRVAFTEDALVSDSDGSFIRSELASCIRIGFDGNIYLGTLSGRVLRLTYDPDSLRVTQKCGSEPLRDSKLKRNGTVAPREILGMVFNPRDRIPRPYVSTQTLFWLARDRIDAKNRFAWRNGAIDRLKPGNVTHDENICLVLDRRVVSGLPVSNHDHGVNGLEFTQTGDLIISIGGNTNAGLPGYRLGERFETPLSGSIIIAKVSKRREFDGRIRYSNDTHPHKGTVIKGDIEFIATGLRNAFFPSLHSSGRLYIADNGPNAGFGNVVSNCSELDANITYPTDPPTDFPGNVKLGPDWSMYSVMRPDKVLNIKLDDEPHYYGHPNPNRGECSYVDPWTNEGPNNEAPPSNYEPPLLTVTSSTNAIVEYHAGNVFNGALKGKLILSTFGDRGTHYIAPITEAGKASLEEVSPRGGLSLAVDAWGNIIIPRLNNNIVVLRPKVPNLEVREEVSITAVTPFRHTKRGRTVATIGGYNFGPGAASVKIGRRHCPVLTQSMTKITCRTPHATSPGKLERVIVTIEGRGSAILPKGLWYMEV